MSHYERPGFSARLLAFFFRLIPSFGPLKRARIQGSDPQIERMFEDSFDAAVKRESFLRDIG